MFDRLNNVLAPVIILSGIVALIAIVNQFNKPKHTSYNDSISFRCDSSHEFSLTLQQISDHQLRHYTQAVPCPVCGSIKVSHDNNGEPEPYATKIPAKLN